MFSSLHSPQRHESLENQSGDAWGDVESDVANTAAASVHCIIVQSEQNTRQHKS